MSFICPVHNAPMKQFPWGWKCTKVIGTKPDGTNAYCPQKGQTQPGQPLVQQGAYDPARASQIPTPVVDTKTKAFEARDRLMAAQTALNVSSNQYKPECCSLPTPQRHDAMLALTGRLYGFLMGVYEGEGLAVLLQDLEVQNKDIPF